jgi:hypothetical protein
MAMVPMPLADADDLARGFEAENVGRPGRHLVAAEPLQEVGAVEPGRLHLDQHLVPSRLRNRPFDNH